MITEQQKWGIIKSVINDLIWKNKEIGGFIPVAYFRCDSHPTIMDVIKLMDWCCDNGLLIPDDGNGTKYFLHEIYKKQGLPASHLPEWNIKPNKEVQSGYTKAYKLPESDFISHKYEDLDHNLHCEDFSFIDGWNCCSSCHGDWDMGYGHEHEINCPVLFWGKIKAYTCCAGSTRFMKKRPITFEEWREALERKGIKPLYKYRVTL